MNPALTYTEDQSQKVFAKMAALLSVLIDEINDSTSNELQQILPFIEKRKTEIEIEFLTLNKTHGSKEKRAEADPRQETIS